MLEIRGYFKILKEDIQAIIAQIIISWFDTASNRYKRKFDRYFKKLRNVIVASLFLVKFNKPVRENLKFKIVLTISEASPAGNGER